MGLNSLLVLLVVLCGIGCTWSVRGEESVGSILDEIEKRLFPDQNNREMSSQALSAFGYGSGGMYLEGSGVEKDYGKAIKYFKMVAEQGNMDAQYALGSMYYNMVGVEQDFDESFKWCLLAAEQEHIEASG